MRSATRILTACLIGAAPWLLGACGGSSKGLIPAQNAGPLQGDFEAVARAAQAGDGNCSATAAAIRSTERDFEALPPIDAALHSRLSEGIANLRERALELCAQPLASATTTTSSPRTSSSTTSTTTTTTTVRPTETSTSTRQTSSAPGGGAIAPSGGSEATPGAGQSLEAEGGGAGTTGGTGQGVEP
jgi:hypothetical protein